MVRAATGAVLPAGVVAALPPPLACRSCPLSPAGCLRCNPASPPTKLKSISARVGMASHHCSTHWRVTTAAHKLHGGGM